SSGGAGTDSVAHAEPSGETQARARRLAPPTADSGPQPVATYSLPTHVTPETPDLASAISTGSDQLSPPSAETNVTVGAGSPSGPGLATSSRFAPAPVSQEGESSSPSSGSGRGISDAVSPVTANPAASPAVETPI